MGLLLEQGLLQSLHLELQVLDLVQMLFLFGLGILDPLVQLDQLVLMAQEHEELLRLAARVRHGASGSQLQYTMIEISKYQAVLIVILQRQSILLHRWMRALTLAFLFCGINITNMRFNEILAITFANTPMMREKKIQDLYSQMQDNMKAINEKDNEAKENTERIYLKAYLSVMEKMSNELGEVKARYENLDRDRLKDEKCEKLAEDVKIFREECYLLKAKIAKMREAVRKERIREDLLDRERIALKENMRKIQSTKNENKRQCEKLSVMFQLPQSKNDILLKSYGNSFEDKCIRSSHKTKITDNKLRSYITTRSRSSNHHHHPDIRKSFDLY